MNTEGGGLLTPWARSPFMTFEVSIYLIMAFFYLDQVCFIFEYLVYASHAWFFSSKTNNSEKGKSFCNFVCLKRNHNAAKLQKDLVKFSVSVKSKYGRKLVRKQRGLWDTFLAKFLAVISYVHERIWWIFGFFCLYQVRSLYELVKGFSAFITLRDAVKEVKKEEL